MRRIRISRLQHLVLDAGSGIYSLSGHNSDLLKARHLIASLLPGVYSLAGNNATLTRQTRLLSTISGTYSYVGNPATLTWATSPNITTAPIIIGIPTVGIPVSYTAGNVTGSPVPTRTQQWLLDGNTIIGATASTYTPITSDAGHNLSVRQIETNTFGSANRTSAGVVVASATADPTWIATIPTITFTKGTASSPFSLAPYLSNYNPALHLLQVSSGTLPTGIGINQTTPSLTYDDLTSVVASNSGIVLTVVDGFAVSYTTNFPLTEPLISEGGKWISGGVNPPRTDVQTDGVHAFGTMISQPSNVFPDSIACLNSFSSNNHRVTGTLYNVGAVSGLEVELVLRCNLTSATNTGYEIDLVRSISAVNFVRWNGPDNNFTIATGFPISTNVNLNDGAVWVAQIVGNIVTVTCNGNAVFTADITTAFSGGLVISSGTPGIGFWCETGNAADRTKFGLRNFSAVAL
jgi:hypothetical protein